MFGIINWTKEELHNINIKTQKLLTSTGSFHINSDIDRLYSYHNEGGRSLNSLVDIYIQRRTQTYFDTVFVVWAPEIICPNNISSTFLRSSFSKSMLVNCISMYWDYGEGEGLRM